MTITLACSDTWLDRRLCLISLKQTFLKFCSDGNSNGIRTAALFPFFETKVFELLFWQRIWRHKNEILLHLSRFICLSECGDFLFNVDFNFCVKFDTSHFIGWLWWNSDDERILFKCFILFYFLFLLAGDHRCFIKFCDILIYFYL